MTTDSEPDISVSPPAPDKPNGVGDDAAADVLLVPPAPRFVGAWRRRIEATRARTAPRACRRHTWP